MCMMKVISKISYDTVSRRHIDPENGKCETSQGESQQNLVGVFAIMEQAIMEDNGKSKQSRSEQKRKRLNRNRKYIRGLCCSLDLKALQSSSLVVEGVIKPLKVDSISHDFLSFCINNPF